ncbi:MAG: RNA 2',3'-cyclic phosphodiesterase [Actinomycetota bacterium]|nr:RNA 2',3'-cyclic phosphodiesterase [Actinomycetota bacterium]MDQ2958911.1 RNA 2',3'-cyclic phosphodiesterase [Actinomycetota bacterium]
MRMFVAVVPPEAVTEHLAEFLEPRHEAAGPLRWTSIEQWHLTLAFLPAVTDSDLDELVEGLADTISQRSSFPLQLMGAGAFPDPAAAKILWAGVGPDPEPLTRLAAATRTAAIRAGVPADGAKYRPHLTLARVNRPLDVTRWLRVLDLYTGPRWQVGELALIESQLGAGPRGRSRYVVHQTFELRSPMRETSYEV